MEINDGEMGASDNDNAAASAARAKEEGVWDRSENLDEMIEDLESILAASQELPGHSHHQSSFLSTFEQGLDCGVLPNCEAEEDLYTFDFPSLPNEPAMDSCSMVDSVWPSDPSPLPSVLPNLETNAENLSNIFAKWLMANSDRVTRADLKQIKLKTSTIEAATKRLGGGRKGMTDLFKLILAWLENHHLPRKRQRAESEVSEGYGGWWPSTVGPSVCNNRSPQIGLCSCTYNHVPALSALYTSQPLGGDRLWHPALQVGSPQAQAMEDTGMQSYRPQYVDTAAASTRAARRSRMARQRWSIRHARTAEASSQLLWPSHQLSPPPGSFSSSPFTPTNGFPRQLTPSGLPRQNKLLDRNLKLLLQKELKQSDVGNLGRIVLPKKEAELNLPYLASRDGLNLDLEDWCCFRVWNMRYRFWPNNKSRMYLLENTGDFVKLHRMDEGDHLMLYIDACTGNFVIRGAKLFRQGASNAGMDKSSSSSTTSTGEGRAPKSVQSSVAIKSEASLHAETHGRKDGDSCKNTTPNSSFCCVEGSAGCQG